MRLSIHIGIAFACCMALAYVIGRHDERLSIDHERDAMIAACRENNTILQRRYDSIARETDWLSTVSAELKYQEAGQ